jgi:hypothetical protein
MYTVAIFLSGVWHTDKGVSAEDTLGRVEKECGEKLHFKPMDGTVYANYSHIPCGVIYRKGYMQH